MNTMDFFLSSEVKYGPVLSKSHNLRMRSYKNKKSIAFIFNYNAI